MTSVLLPEGELRVARCDMLDKLIAVGDGDAALLYLYILRHGGTDGSALSAKGLVTPNYFTGACNFHSYAEFLPLPSLHKSLEMTLELVRLTAGK